jgi:hypothetical protein
MSTIIFYRIILKLYESASRRTGSIYGAPATQGTVERQGLCPREPDATSCPSLQAVERGGAAMKLIKNFLSEGAGATAIEYGLIAAGISQ